MIFPVFHRFFIRFVSAGVLKFMFKWGFFITHINAGD